MAAVGAAAYHAWRAAPHSYLRAVVRALPSSFAAAALRQSAPPTGIAQLTAEAQHKAYVAALEKAGVSVTALPADDTLPDSCFVEDTAVVVGDTALISRPGAPSRAAETKAVEDAMRALGLRIVHAPAGSRLDGGDVLFTGREFFVGMSARTNAAGATAVAAAFPGIPVTPIAFPSLSGRPHAKRRAASAARAAVDAAIAARRAATAAALPQAKGASAAKLGAVAAANAAAGTQQHSTSLDARAAETDVDDGHVHGPDCGHSNAAVPPLHLKSLLSMVGRDTVAVADTATGIALAEALAAASRVDPRRYPLRFAVVPEAAAANAVLVNGYLIHRSDPGMEESASLLAQLHGGPCIGVSRREASPLRLPPESTPPTTTFVHTPQAIMPVCGHAQSPHFRAHALSLSVGHERTGEGGWGADLLQSPPTHVEPPAASAATCGLCT